MKLEHGVLTDPVETLGGNFSLVLVDLNLGFGAQIRTLEKIENHRYVEIALPRLRYPDRFPEKTGSEKLPGIFNVPDY